MALIKFERFMSTSSCTLATIGREHCCDVCEFLPGDVISFRTITLVDKILIILLVLLHPAHGDFVEVADLFIRLSISNSRYYCSPIDYLY